MDLQEYLTKIVTQGRRERFLQTNQLSLGALIERLELLIPNQKAIKEKYGKEAGVHYDFEYLHPTSIDSWRGSYNELALNFSQEGEYMRISDFLSMLKDCLGKTFQGYKGGDFIMSKDTPIWVANYGNVGNTGISDVVECEYNIMLTTQYYEY